MVDGVHTLPGQVAQLLVRVVSVAEQGLVTTHRQLMEVANARRTVQMTRKQRPATPIHAQVIKCMSISQNCIVGVAYYCS